MSTLIQDLRYGLRMLAKSPAFTVVALITLGLGIGANTAIFSVVNAVVLRPLPYKDPDQLVVLWETISQAGPQPITVSAPDVLDFARQNHVFEAVAGFQNLPFELSGSGQPERIVAARVSAPLFPLLGIEPLLGRTFAEDEDRPGRLVTVLSYGLWQRRYGAEREVIGRTVELDRQPYTIIGVMPPSFVFPLKGVTYFQPADLWVPIAFNQSELANRGDNFDFGVVARLKPAVSLQRANADVTVIAHQIQQTYPLQVRNEFKLGALVTPLRDVVVGKVRTLMAILLGAVGLVLLIACVNVVNLLLVRAAGRHKEIAVRAALGAGRWRLVRQFVSESVILALFGGALGVVLAAWSVSVLVALAPGDIPRIESVRLDTRVLTFTLLLSVITGLVFGTVPALAASQTDLSETLKAGGRTSAGYGHQRLRSVLVVSEVALALVLLVGAGLLIRSFIRVLDTDPGFRPEEVLTMNIALPRATYNKASQLRSFYKRLLDEARALPGIRSVGLSSDLPMMAGWTKIFTPEGNQAAPGAPLNFCKHSVVYGQYFAAMTIPLVRGRYFSDQDNLHSTSVIIISKSIADRYWPGRDPLGKRLKWGPPESAVPWLTVVGVVGDVKPGALDQPTQPHTYESYAQANDEMTGFLTYMYLAVRTRGDALSQYSAVRRVLAGLDTQLAVADVQTMTDVINKSFEPRRFNLFLLGAFAMVAMLLGGIGIYGVISHSVAQRTHEIGLRMALGATQYDVLRLVVAHGVRLAFVGVGVGLVGALVLTRLLSTLLYEIRPSDPLTLAAVSFLLVAVALAASCVPARRATKVDPMVALRHE